MAYVPEATSVKDNNMITDEEHGAVTEGDIEKGGVTEELESVQEQEMNGPPVVKRNWWSISRKIMLFSILLGIILYAVIEREKVKEWLTSFLEWVQENQALGMISFVLIYMVATISFAPGSILTLGAGFIFAGAYDSFVLGIFVGTMVVLVGATLGACGAFLLGRTVLRDAVSQWMANRPNSSTLRVLDDVFRRHGFKLVALLRLSPILPFNVLNYIFSATAVTFRDYALGSIGMIPGTVTYVMVGSSLSGIGAAAGGDGEDEGGLSPGAQIGVIVAGVVVVFMVSIYISVLAKREIRRLTEEEEEKQAALEDKDEDGVNNNTILLGENDDPQHHDDDVDHPPSSLSDHQVPSSSDSKTEDEMQS